MVCHGISHQHDSFEGGILMGMKQFFHLTFIFLILVCLAHSASAITELGKFWQLSPAPVDDQYIAKVYKH